MSDNKPTTISFRDLDLSAPLLRALDEVGYETPSPIQAQAIPYLLEGRDLLGHAPTGTGKTAAFALPLLSRLDMNSNHVQIMTLTPTRELAIQVAEAFKRYAAHIEGFHVLPIYGGADYSGQIRSLQRGVQVVVGTPGRVMDHMRKGTLKLDKLQALVLDEADEMLRMGFIEEVEWILEQTPAERQMALFSATMPKQIERIARKYLNKPQEVAIKAKTATAETIRQRYWQVSGVHKLDAFTRILEVEDFDAMLVFVRTKIMTTEVAEKLEARGYAAAAMNGDMAQKDREKMVERLKSKSLDILVATDVAARGLDVERISHVINYDIPNDVESYIHRIGRTGRAGRSGEAILFVAPRERRMLAVIEKATRQTIEPLVLPTTETVNNKRIANFKQKITDTLAGGDLAFMQSLIEQYRQEHDIPSVEIAAALARLALGDQPFLITADSERQARREDRQEREQRPTRRERQSADDREASKSERPHAKANREQAGEDKRGRDKARPAKEGYEKGGRDKDSRDKPERKGRHLPPAADMERFRIEVGYDHGVKPGNIVGAITNEAGVDGNNVGQIEISEQFTLVDLPKGMPKEIFMDLKKVWVCGQQLKITRLNEKPADRAFDKRDPRTKPRVAQEFHAKADAVVKRDSRAGEVRKQAGKTIHAKRPDGAQFEHKSSDQQRAERNPAGANRSANAGAKSDAHKKFGGSKPSGKFAGSKRPGDRKPAGSYAGGEKSGGSGAGAKKTFGGGAGGQKSGASGAGAKRSFGSGAAGQKSDGSRDGAKKSYGGGPGGKKPAGAGAKKSYGGSAAGKKPGGSGAGAKKKFGNSAGPKKTFSKKPAGK